MTYLWYLGHGIHTIQYHITCYFLCVHFCLRTISYLVTNYVVFVVPYQFQVFRPWFEHHPIPYNLCSLCAIFHCVSFDLWYLGHGFNTIQYLLNCHCGTPSIFHSAQFPLCSAELLDLRYMYNPVALSLSSINLSSGGRGAHPHPHHKDR